MKLRKSFSTLAAAALFIGGAPEITFTDIGQAEAKGARGASGAAKGKTTIVTPKTTPPKVAAGGKGGGVRPPFRAAAAPTPPKPPSLTPIFNHHAGRGATPPPKTDKATPTLKPKGPTFKPPGL